MTRRLTGEDAVVGNVSQEQRERWQVERDADLDASFVKGEVEETSDDETA